MQYNHGHRQHHDCKFKSAYVHVIVERTTLALGSAVLTRGMLFGWSRFDPSVAWSGAGVVGAWAFGPFEGTSRVPVDREMDNALAAEVRWAVESSF